MDTNTPALDAALRQLADALPSGSSVAVVVVRPADDSGKRVVHICPHGMDDEAATLGADCLRDINRVPPPAGTSN